MLEARKSPLFETVFSVYNRNLLRRRFHSFYVAGLGPLTDFPLIMYGNHSSWWDGLAAFHISRRLGLNSYIMMEEQQLKRFFLFRRLGAFSINRQNPRDALLTLEYSARILKSISNSALWIFPQGEILPNDLRPFVFLNGLARIVKELKSCFLCAVCFRYEFWGNYKPSIFVKIDRPQKIVFKDFGENQKLTRFIARVSARNLDELKNSIISRSLNDFTDII